jgi:hypothetical protein
VSWREDFNVRGGPVADPLATEISSPSGNDGSIEFLSSVLTEGIGRSFDSVSLYGLLFRCGKKANIM